MAHDRVVLALPEKHPLAEKKRLRMVDLNGESFVWFPRMRSPPFFDLVADACKKGGLQMRVVQEAQHNTTLLSLVAAGMGLTFTLHDFLVMKPVGVVLRDLVDLKITLQIRAAWPSKKTSPFLDAYFPLSGRAAKAWAQVSFKRLVPDHPLGLHRYKLVSENRNEFVLGVNYDRMK